MGRSLHPSLFILSVGEEEGQEASDLQASGQPKLAGVQLLWARNTVG